MACMTVPIIIIFLLAAIGSVYKRLAVGQKSILGEVIYEELVFNIFIKSTRVFVFNLLYNSIMFIKITRDPDIIFDENSEKLGFYLCTSISSPV